MNIEPNQSPISAIGFINQPKYYTREREISHFGVVVVRLAKLLKSTYFKKVFFTRVVFIWPINLKKYFWITTNVWPNLLNLPSNEALSQVDFQEPRSKNSNN